MFIKTMIWKIEEDEYLLSKFLFQDFECTVKLVSIEAIESNLIIAMAWNKLRCWKKKRKRKVHTNAKF